MKRHIYNNYTIGSLVIFLTLHPVHVSFKIKVLLAVRWPVAPVKFRLVQKPISNSMFSKNLHMQYLTYVVKILPTLKCDSYNSVGLD